ncbi:MAG: peroxiredoxin family protein [Gemmatimonadales bacterium]
MATRGQWTAVGGILFLLSAAIVAGMALSPDIRPVGPGSVAPDFEATDIVTGDTVKLSDYRGEVVLLNIWATWCGPCEVEMPAIQRLHEALAPRGLRILAVSVDESSSDDVRKWVDERGLTFDVLHNRSGQMERLYQTTGYPETFIIDRDGVILKKEIGAREWDSPAQSAILRRLLERQDTVATSNRAGSPRPDV